MRHKFFHTLDLSVVPFTQKTYTSLKQARAVARKRSYTARMAVCTTDGAIDERWEGGERVERRTRTGVWKEVAR